jgi:rRNA maturation endonuclease Nob1
MIKIEAKKNEDGSVVCAYEVELECYNCGMIVDAEEYNLGTCSDCGEPWNAKKHTRVHATSIPLEGQTS